MSVKRKSRWISDKDRDELLALSSKDCLKTSVFMDNFGEFNGKTKFHTYDIMKVPKGTYHNNKNEFVTTVGSWFFNKGCIDYPDLFKEIGYINEPITKKVYKKIQDKLSMAIMEDRVTTDQYKQWIMCCQKFMNYSTIICTTVTEDYLLISKNMSKKKEELFKKYEKELANGDAFAMEKVEQELLKECSDMMDGDPAWDNVKSGSGADLGNNIKTQYICKGAQRDPDPTKGYNIIKSCYAEGVSASDYSAMANSLAAGPYARAKKTASWGYTEKLYLAAMSHIKLDKRGSDCGTKRTITVELNDTNMKLMMYSYIVEGSRLVRLDSTTIDKYRGKTVKMRFSSMCKHDHICNKCAGDLYYILGVENVGTATPQLASTVKGIMMKSFHDSTEHFIQMNAMDAFGE